MSENSIVGKAFRINEFDFFNCPKDVAVPCGSLHVQGVVWFIPTQSNGAQTGYQQRRSQTKPTPDSVKTVRVKDQVSGSTYWLLINDNENESIITDTCAECCGAVTPLPNVIIPTIIIEEVGCPEIVSSVETYNYLSIAPVSSRYRAVGSKNGVAFTPAQPGAGFATLAALVVWADANWSAYGDFSVVGQTVTFSSSDALTGYLNVSGGTVPTASAGPDQALVSGTTTTTLTSIASTSGTGSIVGRLWAKVSGPGTQVISTPAGTTTVITGLEPGTFVFSVTITNSIGLTSTDNVSVVVAA